MKWLVTVGADSDLDVVAQRLESVGCVDVDTGSAIPIGDDELTISVEGPQQLPELVQDEPAIKGVFNDSDIELY